MFKAIRKFYPRVKIYTCFFHFSQALWRNASERGLREEGILELTKEVIFNLKVLPFLSLDNVKKRFEITKKVFNEEMI